MHGLRVWLRALPAFAVLAGSVALAAPASATRPAACRLLDSPVVRQSISLGGELELKVRCGLIARPASRPPR